MMKINKRFFKDIFSWGFLLWLLGYLLGLILFFIVPKSMIGLTISPVAILVTLWILIKKVKSVSLPYYFLIAVILTHLAIVLDYFLLVKVFKPEDGYYKPDVYLYYALTFILPLLVGLWKRKKSGLKQIKN